MWGFTEFLETIDILPIPHRLGYNLIGLSSCGSVGTSTCSVNDLQNLKLPLYPLGKSHFKNGDRKWYTSWTSAILAISPPISAWFSGCYESLGVGVNKERQVAGVDVRRWQ